jgi:hypothetical protein
MPNPATIPPSHSVSDTRRDMLALLAVATGIALLHLLTNARYGLHRDELQFLSDARHLDWGFVAYPPITPLLERLSLHLFGLSLVGLRLFSVLAQSTAIVLTGLIARELGGRRLAQCTAAFAVALSPLPLFEGTEFQYSSFDFLWWVLAAYFLARLLRTEDPRLWIPIGLTLGLGLETKYTILFFIAGILGALLFTPARRWFLSKWFYAGVGLALLVFLPNFLWQARHGFISQQFLAHIHTRDVAQGRGDGFLRDQFRICANLAATPLWIAGLIACLRSPRFRMVGWMYLIPLALFLLAHARFYYVAPTYPMLFAMGAVVAERWLPTLRRPIRLALPPLFFTAVAVCGTYFIAILIPIASSGPLRDFALKNNGDLREEIGWPELVQTVAHVRDALPPDQQQSLGIVVGNYGEQGAIEILGPAYHLPAPISTTNSAWLRGYPTSNPTTLIVLGFSARAADAAFTNCRVIAHLPNTAAIHNEESDDHPDLRLCGPPRLAWPEFWARHQSFG